MSEPMTTEELERIERMWAAATPGPWRLDVSGWERGDSDVIVSGSGAVLSAGASDGVGGASATDADMRALAASWEHVAALVAEVRRLRGVLAEAEDAMAGYRAALFAGRKNGGVDG